MIDHDDLGSSPWWIWPHYEQCSGRGHQQSHVQLGDSWLRSSPRWFTFSVHREVEASPLWSGASRNAQDAQWTEHSGEANPFRMDEGIVPSNSATAMRQMDARTGTWDQWLARVQNPEYLQLGLFQEPAVDLVRDKLVSDRTLTGFSIFPLRDARTSFDVSMIPAFFPRVWHFYRISLDRFHSFACSVVVLTWNWLIQIFTRWFRL